MIASDIRTRCKNRFSDQSGIVRTDAEWLDYINAAYRRFAQAARPPALVKTDAVSIAAGGRAVALPAAALQGGVVAVFDGTNPLLPQPDDIPWKRIRYMTDMASKMVWWKVQGTMLTVLPAPAALTNVTIHYMGAPVALAATDTPAIPETYHDALVAGAMAMAYRDDGNPELAGQYDGEFAAFVDAAKADWEAA